MQSALLRAVRAPLRLPSPRPGISLRPTSDRINPAHWWAAKRWAAHAPLPTGARRHRASDVADRRDAVVGTFSWNPLPLVPLPLRVPIPVEMALPLQQATNAEGYSFTVEATCDCTCELYQPRSAADVRAAVVSAAQAAVRAETMQGGWRYHSSTTGWEMDAYADRIMARLASSPITGSVKINFRNYRVTGVRFDPMDTLAAAAARFPEAPVAPVAAAFVHIIRDARPMTTEDAAAAAATATTNFLKRCATARPPLPPQNTRWTVVMIIALLTVATFLALCFAFCAAFLPDKWTEHKDAAIKAYAESFKHASSWGVFGESLTQRRDRMLAEEQQRLQEEERKKMMEEVKRRVDEERKKMMEEFLARRRYEATMTPWQRVLYRLNVGDRRFQSYRRP